MEENTKLIHKKLVRESNRYRSPRNEEYISEKTFPDIALLYYEDAKIGSMIPSMEFSTSARRTTI